MSVDCSCFSPGGSLFHARGAATEKARSPIRRRVRGMTKLPRVEVRSAHRASTSATGVSRSEMYSGVCPRRDLWHSKHNLYCILSAIGNQCNSWSAGVTRSRGLRSRTVRVAVCRTRWSGASVEAGRPASTALQQSKRDRTSAVTSLAVTSWPSCLRICGADDRNTSARHVKRASASTAQRRTTQPSLGRQSLAWWRTGWHGRHCSVMAADAAATQNRTTVVLSSRRWAVNWEIM